FFILVACYFTSNSWYAQLCPQRHIDTNRLRLTSEYKESLIYKGLERVLLTSGEFRRGKLAEITGVVFNG
ncbi:TPA: hypothetical protein ACGHOU_005010, partial [Salmonella enterica subsp. enterica serovar Corvallis]